MNSTTGDAVAKEIDMTAVNKPVSGVPDMWRWRPKSEAAALHSLHKVALACFVCNLTAEDFLRPDDRSNEPALARLGITHEDYLSARYLLRELVGPVDQARETSIAKFLKDVNRGA